MSLSLLFHPPFLSHALILSYSHSPSPPSPLSHSPTFSFFIYSSLSISHSDCLHLEPRAPYCKKSVVKVDVAKFLACSRTRFVRKRAVLISLSSSVAACIISKLSCCLRTLLLFPLLSPPLLKSVVVGSQLIKRARR